MGLSNEIVKAVVNGEIIEPITFIKIKNYCNKKEIAATVNQMRVILSNGSENTHSPNYKKYFKKVGYGKYSILPEFRRERKFYWLNVDSTKYKWSFSDSKVGECQRYSNLNPNGNRRKNEESFKDIQIGDLIVAYETGQVKAITAVCEVVDKFEENSEILIDFQKKIDFKTYLYIDAIKASPALSKCSAVHFRRGTLLSLKEHHFKTIVRMLEMLNSQDYFQEELDDAVKKSLKDSSEERRKRLNKRVDMIPATFEVKVKAFKRDADVIAEVLSNANGICEKCKKAAPFKRIDGTPYLEVHHKIWLSKGGKDTVDNAIAVCPNCHREFHYGDQNGRRRTK